MLLALFLSYMVAGSHACSDDHCKDRDLAEELVGIRFLPDQVQLERLCPKVLTFLECEKEFFECPGLSLEELAASSEKEESIKGKAMLAGMDLVRELCDEESSFHDDYLGSVDCYRKFIEGSSRKCYEETSKPIEEFFGQIYPNEEDSPDTVFAEIRCLTDAFLLACIIDNLGDSCGSVAQRTAVTVLERMKDPLKAGSCSVVENAADLKSRFLDFLELNEEKRSRHQFIFDMLKRRR